MQSSNTGTHFPRWLGGCCACALLFAAGCASQSEAKSTAATKPSLPLTARVESSISYAKAANDENQKLSENIIDRNFFETPFIVTVPDPIVMGKQNPLADMEQSGNSDVNLKVIDKRFTDSKIYITLLMQNFGESGIRRRLFAFGYDKKNRLLDSSNKSLYFQPHEQMVESYTFNRNDDITRWFFALR